MTKTIWTFLFTCITLIGLSQGAKEYKYVPYFSSLTVPMLSKQLTRGLESDEEKVKAIYSWISHSIKYDVDQWLGFNTEHSSSRHILFRRKGSSADFSYLFAKLCRYASVPNVIVSGYLKNEYTDYGYQYISDDHTWNAIYLNNEWKLYDVCLDAGKIEYYKRTFAGYFVYLFSLGTSDRLVYKPHFQKSPSLAYYALSGDRFKKDHAPANRLWQLVNPNYSLTHFETDSSYFLQKEINSDNYKTDTSFNEERWMYYQMSESEKEISDGKEAFQFNPKNNFRYAKGLFIQAQLNTNKVFEENENRSVPENIKPIIDSANSLLSKSITLLDTNLVVLKAKKNELITASKAKKEIIKEQNKRLSRSTDTKQKTISSAKIVGVQIKITEKTTKSFNKSIKRKITKDKTYKNTDSAYKTNIKDSTENRNLANMHINSIVALQLKINASNTLLHNQKNDIINNLKQIKENTVQNISTQKIVCDLRLDFYDDFDKEIRNIKDSLSPLKLKIDSLLIDTVYKNKINAYYKEFNNLKRELGKLYKEESNLQKHLIKLKKCTTTSSYIDSIYMTQKEEFKKYCNAMNSEIVNFNKEFKDVIKLSKELSEPVKEEKHLYTKELYIDNQLSSVRSFFINRYYKSQVNRSKRLQKDASKQIKSNLKSLKN